jgi:hypothetical protein
LTKRERLCEIEEETENKDPLKETPNEEISESTGGRLLVTDIRGRCEEESGDVADHGKEIEEEIEIVVSVDRTPEEGAVVIERQETDILFLTMLGTERKEKTTEMTDRGEARDGRGGGGGGGRGGIEANKRDEGAIVLLVADLR